MSQLIEADDFNPFGEGELSHTAPLTAEQEEIWLSLALGGQEANLAYNEAIGLTLRGALNLPALRRGLELLVERHEALRCQLSGDGRELCFFATGSLPLEELELHQLAPAQRESELAQLKRRIVLTPFDVVRGPLARAWLVKLSHEEHVFILSAHHIICDGWSGAMLLEELGALYTAEASGTTAALAPAPQLSEYARRQRQAEGSPQTQRDHAYWVGQFREVPAPLELPLDKPRPKERGFAAARIDKRLPVELVQRLKQLGAREGASFVVVLLAAFEAYLARLTGQRSLVVAVPAAGQSILGLEALVGHCVHTLPLRAEVALEKPFGELLKATRTALFDALEHPEITFGSLLKHLALPRDPSRLPLVSVMFNVDPDVGVPEFAGLEVTLETLPRAYENFELFINATVSGDAVTLETTFSTALFEAASIEQHLAGFQALLESIVEDPKQTAGELRVMPPEERAWLLEELNATERPVPGGTFVKWFLEQAARDPARVAVTSAGVSLSYGELAQASAALALQLSELGLGPGQRVGVLVSRSVELLAALFGVLRVGAAYVPLDPEYPAERLRFIASDAGLTHVVTEPGLAAQLPPGAQAVHVAAQRRSDAALDRSDLATPAYIIYTSGSTGQPKGVVVLHRNVANFLSSMAACPGISSGSKLVAVTTPCFDISVLELFLPLTVGAEVVIATTSEVTSGEALSGLLGQGATHFQATPSGYRVLLEAGWQGDSGLTALVGGEALSLELASEVLPRVGALYNMYGPTETTVWSTIEKSEGGSVSIGRPIANTQVYVLDEALRPVPRGAAGELVIGGYGVTAGYWNRPELTESRFVQSPFRSGERLYRTGDLVRVRADGKLEWLRRLDFQVKVRGHRVELGEIEAALSETRGVREAVAVVREDTPGDQRIVAYLRLEQGASLDEGALREALRQKLPSYMLPQHLVVLTAFPLTPNGKLDRKALPRPQASGQASRRKPETPVALKLAEELSALLGVRDIGLEDDFFALGGHSLLALRLGARVRTLYAVELPLRTVFSRPTLGAMSDFVEAALALREKPASVLAGELEELVL